MVTLEESEDALKSVYLGLVAEQLNTKENPTEVKTTTTAKPKMETYICVGNDKPKTGRNMPCPCGSGKKYKKCCLLKGE